MIYLLLFLLAGAARSEDLSYLEQSLATEERGIEQIVPKTEKKIVFFSKPEKTENVLIYFHGFSASRQEVSPVPESIAQGLAANLFFQRFKGHGISGTEGLRGVHLSDWQNDIEAGLALGKTLGRKIFVMASSTAAPLVIDYLGTAGDLASSLVLLSPNFKTKNFFFPLLSIPLIGDLLLKLILGEYRTWIPKNPQQGIYWTTKYPSAILKEVYKATNLVTLEKMRKLTLPTLIFYNPQDLVVDAAATEDYFRALGSADKILYPITTAEDDHILSGDIMSPSTNNIIEKATLKFLGR